MPDKQEIPIWITDRLYEGDDTNHLCLCLEVVKHSDHLAAISTLAHQLSQEKDLSERLKNANELDRRALWAAVRSIDEEITSRMWLLEGRGSDEWDDDRYRQEFGWAVHALQEKLEPLRKISHDLMNCPETEKGVDSVRKLESENARLTEALRVKEEECERLRDRERDVCAAVTRQCDVKKINEIMQDTLKARDDRALLAARRTQERG